MTGLERAQEASMQMWFWKQRLEKKGDGRILTLKVKKGGSSSGMQVLLEAEKGEQPPSTP